MKQVEMQVDDYLEEQKRSATGQRLEMMQGDMSGTRTLLASVLLPVLKSFRGLTLEYEMVSLSGACIYIDAFYEPLGIAFEAEGYVAHHERITRKRFSFEKMRIRTIGNQDYKFYPFSWDEMDQRPDACRRSVYELLGRKGSLPESRLFQLPVYEREAMRFAAVHQGAFGIEEVSRCLQFKEEASRRVLRSLESQGYIQRVGGSERRCYRFVITELGRELFLS
ncbi:hypothetical protein [Cohnella nanjingensis]|uniref:Uncharacterized protein n=1 Tax=Cohnella nanjingensis TaxID=1387779 RepID=A0A7X0S033_9BACL|nr:hypothetical protein [Cohnella nanjingensis]MBB6675199.1 hypothetical protein [Cohnella nanjingensis]